mgnify:CR=1 FL=1
MQKRLDVYLSENNTVKSRSLAASLIKQGSVEVNGRICTKASFAVDDNDNIRIIGEMPKYVGRGGLKLEKALSHYRLHLDGSVCSVNRRVYRLYASKRCGKSLFCRCRNRSA